MGCRRWPGFSPNSTVFLAAIEAGLIVPSVIGVLASAIGLVYYLRLAAIMFFNEPAPALDRATGMLAPRPIMLPVGRGDAWSCWSWRRCR